MACLQVSFLNEENRKYFSFWDRLWQLNGILNLQLRVLTEETLDGSLQAILKPVMKTESDQNFFFASR